MEDKKLGRLTFGQQSPATDDITLINLGSEMNDAALHYNNNFGIWLNMGSGFITDLKWGQIAHNVDSLRGLFVRYDTPVMNGSCFPPPGRGRCLGCRGPLPDGMAPVPLRRRARLHGQPRRRFRDVRGSLR